MSIYRFYRLRAFTLIELMVTVAIFTIVMSASYALLNAARTSWRSGDASIELQEDVRQVLDSISFELFETTPARITIGAGNNFITFQIPVDENGSGTWESLGSAGTFYLEDTLDASGAIVWGAYLRQEDRTVASSTLAFGNRQGRQIRFLLVGDELTRRVLASDGTTILEDFVLSDDIASVSFSLDANNTVRITVNAQKQAMDGRQVSYSVTTETIPRNS